MASTGRPLSPHLTIYRWYLTMALSIAHRTSGIILTAGLLLIVVWLHALAAGPDAYARVAAVMGSVLGRIFLFLWTLVALFHSANGLRHLGWDLGLGLEKGDARRSGLAVIAAAGILTVLVWILALARG